MSENKPLSLRHFHQGIFVTATKKPRPLLSLMGSHEDGIKMLVNAWQIYRSAIGEPELLFVSLLNLTAENIYTEYGHWLKAGLQLVPLGTSWVPEDELSC